MYKVVRTPCAHMQVMNVRLLCALCYGNIQMIKKNGIIYYGARHQASFRYLKRGFNLNLRMCNMNMKHEDEDVYLI
jgi:hypothetical protein